MAKTQPRGEQILDNTIKLDTPNQDVTGVLPVGNGGTGGTSQTLNNVLLGNGSGALQNVAPGTNGNVLTSNGTTWQSAAAGGGSSPLTTKGDLYGYAAANARIPVGVDGQILVADSGNANGLSYQNVSFLTRRNLQFNSNPGALTVAQYGFAAAPAIVAGAVTTNGDDTDGPFIQLNTTAVANNVSSVATAYTQFRREWEADVSFKIKTTAVALTGIRFWCGLFSAAPGAADTPSIRIAGFRGITTGAQGNANWMGVTADGSATQSTLNTQVAIAVSTTYILRIRCTGSSVEFFVNNKYIGAITTNLPTATTLLASGFYISALAASAVSGKFGWCSVLQE